MAVRVAVTIELAKRVLAVGSTSGCDGRKQATVWEVTDSATPMKLIYQVDPLLESEGKGLAELPGGRIALTGSVRRVIDSKRIDTSGADWWTTYSDSTRMTNVNFDQAESRDMLVVVLDSAGTQQLRTILTFGADAIGNLPLWFNNHLLIAGIVANQASLIELALPNQTAALH